MKIVVFDLDETIGYFTQFGIFWDCLTNYLKETNKISEIKEEMCSKNITEHLHSECCITVDPNDSSLENCIVTTGCLPFKIVLCFPFHIGAGMNSLLNCLCNTDKNYLI